MEPKKKEVTSIDKETAQQFLTEYNELCKKYKATIEPVANISMKIVEFKEEVILSDKYDSQPIESTVRSSEETV